MLREPHWAEKQLTRIPGKSDLAKASRYGLSRWSAHTLFLDDGRLEIDSNAAERALTVIQTAKMNGLDPQAYLADVLDRITII